MDSMIITETTSPDDKQKSDIVTLWNQEYPKKLALAGLAEFEQYLAGLADRHHFLLSDEYGRVKGWLICFVRDGERCFAMMLDAALQGKGWGSRLLNKAKECNRELNGWVIDHEKELKSNREAYKSPVEFYRKNGFEYLSTARSEKKGIDGGKVRWRKSSS